MLFKGVLRQMILNLFSLAASVTENNREALGSAHPQSGNSTWLHIDANGCVSIANMCLRFVSTTLALSLFCQATFSVKSNENKSGNDALWHSTQWDHYNNCGLYCNVMDPSWNTLPQIVRPPPRIFPQRAFVCICSLFLAHFLIHLSPVCCSSHQFFRDVSLSSFKIISLLPSALRLLVLPLLPTPHPPTFLLMLCSALFCTVGLDHFAFWCHFWNKYSFKFSFADSSHSDQTTWNETNSVLGPTWGQQPPDPDILSFPCQMKWG